MIDYKAIIEELDEDKVKNLLNKLEISFVDKGDYLLMRTVCHNAYEDEASEKLYYYKNSHLFVCWTHCGNMSIFTFLKNYYEARNIDYDWYTDIYSVILDCSNYNQNLKGTYRYKSIRDIYKRENNDTELPTYPIGVLDCFVKFYPPEWLEDGISTTAMDKFNIRYSISQNKIIIPHLNSNGELVGIRGRALNEEEVEILGKYMPVKLENSWYTHPLSMNLYGLYENKENIKESGIVYVCESEKAVLQAESFSTPNCCVAVCGSNFNKKVLRLLIKECNPKEIIICFDKEELPGETKYFLKLWDICQKYKNYCNFSFIYDKENLLNLKDSPTDKGEEVFKKLIEKRVIVK